MTSTRRRLSVACRPAGRTRTGGRARRAPSRGGSGPRPRSRARRRSARAARRASALTSRPGASRLTSGNSICRLRRSVSTASAMPGYWILTATARAVGRGRAVDLADRGGGERLLLELAKDVADRHAELVLEQLLDLLERERRDVVAQRRERRLELLALGLGDRGEVDGREHLADLHRRAAHLAELLDELARGRGGALAGRGVGAARRCGACWRRGCRPSAGPGPRRGRRSDACGRCGRWAGSRPLTERTTTPMFRDHS